jgi:hypothetical protein
MGFGNLPIRDFHPPEIFGIFIPDRTRAGHTQYAYAIPSLRSVTAHAQIRLLPPKKLEKMESYEFKGDLDFCCKKGSVNLKTGTEFGNKWLAISTFGKVYSMPKEKCKNGCLSVLVEIRFTVCCFG